MDDMDFDFSDWLGNIESGLDLSGGDTSWLDTVDWGSMMNNLDFSDLDLSNVVGDISAGGLDSLVGNFAEDVESQAGGFYGNVFGKAEYDPRTNTTELYDPTTDTLRTITHGGGADILEGFDESEFFRDIEDDGVGTVEIVGERPDTLLTDEEQTRQFDLGDILTDEEHTRQFDLDSILTDEEHTRTGEDLTDPYEIDGKQGSRDEDDILTPTNPPDPKCPPNSNKTVKYADGSTKTFDCKGNLLSSTPKKEVDPEPPKPPKPPIKIDDMSKWAALLGGLLGLLNKPSGGPAGYKGSIPKYMATRGPSRSPTEGGRRPGGAGIGSLTGGVTYTPVGAAGGGLMGLAEGGKARPARYLRGGTDGMADKIQTDIDGKQPARLSHGEFVIPADVVSHLGNGNSDAGADVLYDMMAKVRKARTGTQKQGKQINPRKYTPV